MGSAVNEAKLVLNVDNPFLLEESQQECDVDPIIPNVTFFDQVHVDTGYASDNPDVQSMMAGMDEAAALLANRTDCEFDSDLNFDQLLLGGYFCHPCLPDQDSACSGGGTCTNVQWRGYVCDNEFQVVDCGNAITNAITNATTPTEIINDPTNETQQNTTSSYCLQTLNGTDILSTSLILKPGVDYRFYIELEIEFCMKTVNTDTGEVFELGCGSKEGGPLAFTYENNVDACQNKRDFLGVFNNQGKFRDCDWVSKKNRCERFRLRNKCQTTCDFYGCRTGNDVTCSNKRDTQGRFAFKNKQRSCRWVREKRKSRCQKLKLKDMCRTTCDFNGCKTLSNNETLVEANIPLYYDGI